MFQRRTLQSSWADGYVILWERKIKDKIWENIMDDIDTIENSLVNRFMKLWLYLYYLLSRASWAFLIYNFDRTFAFELEKKLNLKLKKWAGIYQKVDNGLLFRSKEKFGLGIS